MTKQLTIRPRPALRAELVTPARPGGGVVPAATDTKTADRSVGKRILDEIGRRL